MLEDRVGLLERGLVRHRAFEQLHQVEQDRQVVHSPGRHVDLAAAFGEELAGLRVEAVVEPQLCLRDALQVGVGAELVLLCDFLELNVGRGQPQVEARRVGEHDAALAAEHAVEQVAGEVGEFEFGRQVLPRPHRVQLLRGGFDATGHPRDRLLGDHGLVEPHRAAKKAHVRPFVAPATRDRAEHIGPFHAGIERRAGELAARRRSTQPGPVATTRSERLARLAIERA